MKVLLARRAGELVEQGVPLATALQRALDVMATRVGGAGGLIGVTPQGGVAHAFTTTRMAWAQIAHGCLKSGIDVGEEMCEELKQ